MVMGIWYFMAGSVVRGCSTFAPKYDSSHASWYVMDGRHTASGTWAEYGGAYGSKVGDTVVWRGFGQQQRLLQAYGCRWTRAEQR